VSSVAPLNVLIVVSVGRSLEAVTLIVRVAGSDRLFTPWPSLAMKVTVRASVLGFSLVLTYFTPRNAAW